MLLEVVEDHGAATLVDALGDTAGVPVLLHGEDDSCWPVFDEALRRGLDVRIGLEDTMTLPDGSPVAGNAQLVAAASTLLHRREEHDG